jgi:hypothetical protein
MPFIHSVIASAIPLYTWHQTCHSFILSYQVPFLYTRGTSHAINSFCLIKCHPFIHVAPDMPFIQSVLASATPCYTRRQTCHPYILYYPVPSNGTKHVIHSFCLIQCHPFIHAAPDFSFIHSVLSSAIVHICTCGTRHVIHSFCLSQCHSFTHVAPDMPSIHSVLSSATPLVTWHQTCHPFILS